MLKRPRLLAAAVAVAASATVAITGLTSASASPAVRPAVSGTEHFQLVTTANSTNHGLVIAYGVFTGPGVDKVTGNNTDTFKFKGGSLKIWHSNGKGTQHFNPKTCLDLVSQHGTYKLSHGTGKLAGVSGHGKYKLTVEFIAARSKGKCTRKTAASQTIIDATGPFRL